MLLPHDFKRMKWVEEQIGKEDLSEELRAGIRIVIQDCRRGDSNAANEAVRRYKMADTVAAMIDTGDLRRRLHDVTTSLENLQVALSDVQGSSGFAEEIAMSAVPVRGQ